MKHNGENNLCCFLWSDQPKMIQRLSNASFNFITYSRLSDPLIVGRQNLETPPGVLYNYNGIPGISDMRRSRKVPSLSLIYLSLVDGEGVSLVSSYRENRADLSLNICACLLPLATRDPISSSRRNLRQ